MNFLSKQCPTFSRLGLWLWNSPTFTTWGNYGVQSLRLILVTPLILTRFDESEIAAWYLFASLNFFGATLSQRLAVTFSRMFAFAMGGASNLAPIKGKRDKENDGKPNWAAFERAYGTIGSLNLGIGWLNVLVALAMGWFGLSNILSGYEAKGVIWLAFALMQASTLLGIIFQRYMIALQGMNYIALTNRWGIIFSLLSVAAGSMTLWLGGGIVALVLVMQFLAIAGVFCNRFLLKKVENGRVMRFRQYGFDREVFDWAWEPSWKGIVLHIADLGVIQIGVIIFTSIGGVTDVASYLFSVQIVRSLTAPCNAPLYSAMPFLGRLMASGEVSKLAKIYIRRSMVSQLLLSICLCLLLFGGNKILGIIGAQTSFISREYMLLLVGVYMHAWFINYTGSITTLGNNLVLVSRSVVSSVISILLLYPLTIHYSILGLVIATWGPRILILNVGYVSYASKTLNLDRSAYVFPMYLVTFLSSVFMMVFYFL
jgi:hypothetical protein